MTNYNSHQKALEITSLAQARNNFKGNLDVKALRQTPCFSGAIHKLKDIKVEYHPEYPLHKLPCYYKDNAFELTLDALVEHEITHKANIHGEGCPKNEELDLEKILVPISKVLKKKGFPNVPFGSQGHTLYTYFANLFEDSIVNTLGCREQGPDGFFLLYNDSIHHQGKPPGLFEAFLKIQTMTFPSIKGLSLLIPYLAHDKKAKKAVENYLKKTGIKDISRVERVDFLANSDNWEGPATIFAEELSELVDKNNLPPSYFPIPLGNDFVRLNDEEVQMELAMKSYGKKGGSFEPPEFMEDNSALLALYRRLAKNIDMNVNSHSIETKRTISHVSRRQFDFDKDSLEGLIFDYNSHGELEAQTGKYPIVVKSRYQVSAGSFPEVRVGLLDCSGSTQTELRKGGKIMNPWAKKDKQWTDTSIYHQELLSAFGLFELFRRRGALKKSQARLGVFSDRTRIGNDLEESERYALQPDFGGTTLNKEALKIFEGRGSIVYTISDGEIQNWESIKEKFIEGAKRHYYFHLQIGDESEMSNDLKSAGLKSIRCDGNNSAKILIDLTQKEIYGVGK